MLIRVPFYDLLWTSRRQQGQGTVEYGLIIALIAIAAVGGLMAFGGNVGAFYGVIQTAVNALAGS